VPTLLLDFCKTDCRTGNQCSDRARPIEAEVKTFQRSSSWLDLQEREC